MRQAIALAPHLDAAPPEPHGPAIRTSRFYDFSGLAAMRRALDTLARAQRRFHEAYGTYRPSAARVALPAADPPGLHVAVLTWSDTAWSAAAMHDSVAGSARCVIRVVRNAAEERSDGPVCRDPLGADVSLSPTAATRTDTPPADDVEPPRRRPCPAFRLRDPEHRARVTLDAVFGVDGSLEPRELTIVESTGHDDSATALHVVIRCEHDPARLGGEPIRVWVRVPIHIN
jgi:hypothetical protein